MELKDLFSRGSHLSDVPPTFRGMPFRQWRMLKISEQSSKYLSTLDPAKAPLSAKAVWNPRDSYGIKGL